MGYSIVIEKTGRGEILIKRVSYLCYSFPREIK
jgi:hypothetical protein